MSSPWQEYLAGIGSPSANADDVNDIRASDAVGLVITLTSADGELLFAAGLADVPGPSAVTIGVEVDGGGVADGPELHPPTRTAAIARITIEDRRR